jgi:hypothetical protein
MLHLLSTILFLGSGTFSLAVIAATLIDNQPAIQRALGLRGTIPPLPNSFSRVRIIRTQRLMPAPPVRNRAAA